MLRYEIEIAFKSAIRSWQAVGMNEQFIVQLIGRPSLLLFNKLAFHLDNVFCPAIHQTKVLNPVFITGHPRSGTTFFHRLLSQTDEFSCFEFWHTMFSSLIARKIFSPVEQFLRNKRTNKVLIKESGHYISLNSIEEEEFLLFNRFHSPMTSLFSPLAFSSEDHWDMFYFDEQPDALRNELIRYVEGCFQRQIVYLGRKQVLAKMPYAMLRVKSFLEVFPDAKFIYLIRSPYEVIPSFLSLIRAIHDNFRGLDNISPYLMNTIYNRIYEQSLRYYRRVEALENQGVLNSKQFMILPYDLLKTDLQRAVDNFLKFTGMDISQKLKAKIRMQAEKQRSYSGEHQNLPLEYFGFSTEKLKKDFGFVIDKYGFEKNQFC